MTVQTESNHVRCIAHRGGTGLRPENTLASFRHGLSLGADGIELDVHLTADNVVVVHHDATTNPATTRKNGTFITERTPIAAMNFADLAELDVGTRNPEHPYARRHPEQVPLEREPIPTLEQVLEILPDEKWLMVEIKSSVTEKIPLPEVEALTLATMEVLESASRLKNTIIMAFDWRALAIARQFDADCHCSYTTVPRSWIDGNLPAEHRGLPESLLTRMRTLSIDPTVDWVGGVSKIGPSIPQQIAAVGGHFWTPYFRDASEAAVTEARELGIQMIPWTVDAEEEIRRLNQLDVWGVITDRPDTMLATIQGPQT